MQTFADKVSFTLMGNGLFTETYNKDAHLRIQIFFTHFHASVPYAYTFKAY